jgi:hypothetical protein
MDVLLPHRHDASRRWLTGLIEASAATSEATWRRRWHDFFLHHKGELDGQRGIDLDAFVTSMGLAPSVEADDLLDGVLGTYAYLALTAQLLALRRLQDRSDEHHRELLARSTPDLAARLVAITSGEAFAPYVQCPPSPLALAPLVETAVRRRPERARTWLRALGDASPTLDTLLARPNPFGDLHASIVPNALLHPTGEHDTPVWMAEQLLRDVGWQADRRLLDPFAGSGAVLLAALNEASRRGRPPLDALESMAAIELNPLVATLARANLAAELAPACRETDRRPTLPVWCADALSPVVDDVGTRQGSLWEEGTRRLVLGTDVTSSPALSAEALDDLDRRGTPLPPSKWIEPADTGHRCPSTLQQALVAHLADADYIVTNPPWVGWEYIPDDYRETTRDLWTHYGLFDSTGREAAFLKDDLSTLALTVALDHYLADEGRMATVLRRATITSRVAASGLRRLRLEPHGLPLRLEKIRVFEGFDLFDRATTESATWTLEKGEPTTFPIEAVEWRLDSPGAVEATIELDALRERLDRRSRHVHRRHPGDPESPWVLGDSDCLRAARRLRGTTSYRARTGVFTGGANAVYYLEPLEGSEALADETCSWYRNRTERGRRSAPETCTLLEDALVYDVVGGSDLERWHVGEGSHLLCPHSEATGMSPIPPETLQTRHPAARRYLDWMRPVLEARRGFSGWEDGLRDEAFYALLRLGPYAFEPYKVAWRYIADDFIVAVVGPDDAGRPRLPNDKLAYVGLPDRDAAHFLCGWLSSSPIRWQVNASTTSTQMSAGLLEGLALPTFDPSDANHRRVADASMRGHDAHSEGRARDADAALDAIDTAVADWYDFDGGEMAAFRDHLDEA